MKKSIKSLFLISTFAVVLFNFYNVNAAPSEVITLKSQPQVVKTAKPVSAPTVAPVNVVSPVEVVKNPDRYLNKDITFNAEFVAYTALGLDYKPAFKDSTKNIGVLIRRNDVYDHVIPLSEMKIFICREMAEKNMDIEAGDKVKITGKVFSTALGDPWVDVKSFTVTSKKAKK